MSPFSDNKVRLAAFEWLRQQAEQIGDVLPRSLLEKGFDLDGARVPLVGPAGIFKPRVLESVPLSITTTVNGPYQDAWNNAQSFLSYRYRGKEKDRQHRDNVGLREAMRLQRPLVYFLGIVPGKYLAVWPVYIVNDNPSDLSFGVAVDEACRVFNLLENGDEPMVKDSTVARREYITSTVRHRVHQSAFREKVLRAYREQCSLCHLKHAELLEAAHIIPDAEPEGEPLIINGIALCKLHHAAFDRHFLGIRPDYTVILREDVLHETDGPMLLHGLQGMHGQKLVLPFKKEQWPDPNRLAERFARFRRSA